MSQKNDWDEADALRLKVSPPIQRPRDLGMNPSLSYTEEKLLEMWANAQRDGRPAEYRWRPLFKAAKFG